MDGGSQLPASAPMRPPGVVGCGYPNALTMPGRMEQAQIDPLIVGPQSVTWQFTSDVRLFFAPLYALLLQVAHPTVAAGVRDYSDFDKRPLERLLRTIDYLVLLQYGGLEAAAAGRRLRQLHTRF